VALTGSWFFYICSTLDVAQRADMTNISENLDMTSLTCCSSSSSPFCFGLQKPLGDKHLGCLHPELWSSVFLLSASEKELTEDDLKQLCRSLKMLDSSEKILSKELLLTFFSKGCLCLTTIEM